MRTLNFHVLTLASAALFSGVAAGQEATSSESSSATQLKSGEVRASHLLEATVKRLTGDSIGEVEDVIVSSDGAVRHVVISIGGVLGVGAKIIALPLDRFQVAPDGATLFLRLSEEELEARPAFDLETVADDALQTDNDFAAPTQPTFPEASSPAFIPSDSPPTADDSVVHESSLAVQPEPGVQAQLQPQPDVAEAVAKTKASNQPAGALIGAEVVDADYSAVGRVNDVVVSAEPSQVQVIVELSERLGSAGRLVAVPLPELTIPQRSADDAQRSVDRVEIAMTIAQLEALPQFQY